MKRVHCLILATVCVFSLAAWSGQSKEEERIERVLGQMFTCPDEELRKVFFPAEPLYGEEMWLEQNRAMEVYAEYLKENVFTAEDFTENFQTKFCGELYQRTMFPLLCAQENIALSMKSVEIECISEENRSYTYTAELLIEMDGEEIPFTQKGKLQLSEDGRISWIDPYVFNDLTQLLMDRVNAKLLGTAWGE